MSWNYRVVKRKRMGEEWYAIHEVYYDAQGTPETATELAIDPGGNTLDELRSELEHMLKAVSEPVLNYDEIGQPR